MYTEHREIEQVYTYDRGALANTIVRVWLWLSSSSSSSVSIRPREWRLEGVAPNTTAVDRLIVLLRLCLFNKQSKSNI